MRIARQIAANEPCTLTGASDFQQLEAAREDSREFRFRAQRKRAVPSPHAVFMSVGQGDQVAGLQIDAIEAVDLAISAAFAQQVVNDDVSGASENRRQAPPSRRQETPGF